MSDYPTSEDTVNLLIATLGGDGGDMLAGWLAEAARSSGWLIQTACFASASQRTAPVLHYAELFPRNQAPSTAPVFGLFPMQGGIDIAISSEITETGRMLKGGFITPDKTALISSTHQVHSIVEKIDLTDGRANTDNLHSLAKQQAKQLFCYDMQALARKHHAGISSVLFGALAGSQVLSFDQKKCAELVGQTGEPESADRNKAAFNASYSVASGEPCEEKESEAAADDTEIVAAKVFYPKQASEHPEQKTPFVLPSAQTTKGRVLLERVRHSFPVKTHFIVYQGLIKTLDYQDFSYARQYLDDLSSILKLEQKAESYELTNTVARYLALWMSFEDIPRVAELKTRQERMTAMRSEVSAEDNQVMQVTEYVHLQPEDVCACLPAFMSRIFLTFKPGRRLIDFLFCGEKTLHVHKISTYLGLRFLSKLKYLRRWSVSYQHEHKMIQSWLSAIKESAPASHKTAVALAECGRLIKGYGHTRARTLEQLSVIADGIHSQKIIAAEDVKALFEAATKDDTNAAFSKCLGQLDANRQQQEQVFD